MVYTNQILITQYLSAKTKDENYKLVTYYKIKNRFNEAVNVF